jgi:hypothetical protein
MYLHAIIGWFKKVNIINLLKGILPIISAVNDWEIMKLPLIKYLMTDE